jgi:hypothetical protein
VRAFVEFVTRVFEQLDRQAGHTAPTGALLDKPYWYNRSRRKASSARIG